VFATDYGELALSTVGQRKVLCVVMDGIGVRESRFGNAVALAQTNNLDWLQTHSIYTTLKAHGTFVGLPSDADIGNSEVGHNALGAGRIFDQGAKLVSNAIKDESIYSADTWKNLISHLKKTGSTFHLLGLLSDGNVHSHQDHLFDLMRRAKSDGLKKVRIHVLFDGRDVPEKSAEIYVGKLNEVIADLSSSEFDVKVASGGGRMRITMDRYEAEWSMVERGYNLHVHGKGPQFPSVAAALEESRKDPKMTDQYIPEFVIAEDGKPVGKIKTGDAVVFFNFRGDRSIEISNALSQEDFNKFDRGDAPKIFYAGMMEYDGDLHIPNQYLVNPPEISDTLSEEILSHKLVQFACSETQKFGHVTFFWNGNRSGYLDEKYEIYQEIPSDSGIVFDQAPEMKAVEIANATIEQMQKESFNFGRINFANGDMVGHTGNLQATITAVQTVDAQIGRLIEAARATDTILMITADHGNADQMYDGKEKDFPGWDSDSLKNVPAPKTSHTLSEVPLYIFDPRGNPYELNNSSERTLANLANTSLELMGLPQKDSFLSSVIKRSK
jgi:2,3-bisphosphoglycerate-independent phosphoglycerate mutase